MGVNVMRKIYFLLFLCCCVHAKKSELADFEPWHDTGLLDIAAHYGPQVNEYDRVGQNYWLLSSQTIYTSMTRTAFELWTDTALAAYGECLSNGEIIALSFDTQADGETLFEFIQAQLKECCCFQITANIIANDCKARSLLTVVGFQQDGDNFTDGNNEYSYLVKDLCTDYVGR